MLHRCSDLLRSAYEGTLSPGPAPGGPSGGVLEPLAALLVISAAADWDFYFVSVLSHGMQHSLPAVASCFKNVITIEFLTSECCVCCSKGRASVACVALEDE